MLIDFSERQSLITGFPHALRFLQAAHSTWKRMTKESGKPQSKKARDDICKVLKAIKGLEQRYALRDYNK